jgi:cell division protein FtsW
MTPRRQLFSRDSSQLIRKHRPDYLLIILPALLLGIGIVLMVAISPALTAQGNLPGSYYVFRQLVAMVIGVLMFFITSRLPEGFFRKIQWGLVGASIVAAGAVLAISGIAFRWIQIGGFSFQPAELVKFTIIIVSAIFLSDRLKSKELLDYKKTLMPVGVWMLGVAFIVVVLERDLGSMVVMVSIVFAMLFMANVPVGKLIAGALIIAALGGLAIASTPYRRDRFMTFLQPERDCATTGYHACQALIAIGSGGLFGLGLGNSVQAYGYLPEASNDSIFAIYAEKFGFLGSLTLLLIYGALLYRILLVIRRAGDEYSQLVSTGVYAWFIAQAMINIAAMAGLMPLKGITLPFISYGGTSLMFVLAALGLVYRSSSYTVIRRSINGSERGVKHENAYNNNDRRRYSRAYNTSTSRR